MFMMIIVLCLLLEPRTRRELLVLLMLCMMCGLCTSMTRRADQDVCRMFMIIMSMMLRARIVLGEAKLRRTVVLVLPCVVTHSFTTRAELFAPGSEPDMMFTKQWLQRYAKQKTSLKCPGSFGNELGLGLGQ